MQNRRALRAPMFSALVVMVPLAAHAQKTAPEPVPAKIPLEQVLALLEPYPNLKQQVRLALITIGKGKGDVPCTSERLGPTWTQLKGQAVGPYRCSFGKSTLEITTSATYFDAGGHKLAANDPKRAEKAAKVAESRFAWNWK